ncbi:tetratricopeptide (TPR) repeat protein [Catenulispora sp. GP43]|uniref:CHAT domain-containing protein n=1 Tax=Catenulispora sp. GP43 TaxID=3156263 RepID=UPI003513DF0D
MDVDEVADGQTGQFLEQAWSTFGALIEDTTGVVPAAESEAEHISALAAVGRAMPECVAAGGNGYSELLCLLSRLIGYLPETHPRRGQLVAAVSVSIKGILGPEGSVRDITGHPLLEGDPRTTIESMVGAVRSALVSLRREDPLVGDLLSALQSALTLRFAVGGDLRDLHLLVTAARAAVRLEPADSAFRPFRLLDLAGAWHRLGSRDGDERHLNAAIEIGRRVAPEIPADDWRHPLALHKLGVMLAERYEWVGNSADLDDSIMWRREAIASFERLHPSVSSPSREEAEVRMFRSGLMAALNTRYARNHDRADLDDALAIGRENVTADQPSSRVPGEASIRNNYASSLYQAGLADHDARMLVRSARIYRDLIAVDRDLVSRRRLASDRALTFSAIHQVTGDRVAVDRAVTLFERIRDSMDPQDPDAAVQFGHLAHAYLRRYEAVGDASDLENAALAYRSASEVLRGRLLHRLRAAYAWGRSLARLGEWDRALEGFQAAVALLAEVAVPRLRPGDRLEVMAMVFGLPDAAADCALMTSGPERARKTVELLEQARGVLAEQSLGTGDDAALRALDPVLWQIYERRLSDGDAAVDPAVWRETLARIRMLIPDFHRLPSIKDLLADAGDRTVAYIVVSEHRGHCVAVHRKRLVVVPLEMDRDWVVDAASALYKGLGVALGENPGEPRIKGESAVVDVLGRIWETVARPVLDALGFDGPSPPDERGPLPRMWWIPCGLTALLPLHAAGRWDPEAERWSDSVLDRVVPSYAATLRGLVNRGRRPVEDAAEDAGQDPDVVVIAPDDPSLPGLPRERAILEDYVPQGSRGVVLTEADLPSQHVVERLARCRVAHLACHGEWDRTDPHGSGFRLGPSQTLTVRELARLDLPHAELAYLSACNTALSLTSALQTLDEGLTLATAMHVAGFRNVVGSWWPVNDLIAVRMVRELYAAMASDPGGGDRRIDPRLSPTAVHSAVKALRSRNPGRPSLWAAHIHVGG